MKMTLWYIRRRSGIALVLVVAVLAIAAIMSYAMLSSASLQAQVGGTGNLVASADALAESGVNYALYYLQHPELAPSLNSNGVYPGETNVSLSGTTGTFDVSVSSTDRDGSTLPNNTYLVTSVSHVNSINRTVYVKAYVVGKYKVVSALSVINDISIPALVTLNVTDDTTPGYTRNATDPLVRADGQFILGLLSTVTGTVAGLLTNATDVLSLPKFPTQACPTLTGANELNVMKNYTTYTWNGQTYTADPLTWDPYNETISTSNTTTNPLNVWYTTSARNMKGNVTLVGTLIVASGQTLKISGNTTITAKPDPSTGKPAMPALVVDKAVSFEGSGHTLTVNGLMWVSQQILANILTGINWKLNVNGALMLPGSGSQVTGLWNGTMNIKYVQNNVDLPNLSDKDQVPQSVKLLSWSNQ